MIYIKFYNVGNEADSDNTKRHPIPHSHRRVMGCLLWALWRWWCSKQQTTIWKAQAVGFFLNSQKIPHLILTSKLLVPLVSTSETNNLPIYMSAGSGTSCSSSSGDSSPSGTMLSAGTFFSSNRLTSDSSPFWSTHALLMELSNWKQIKNNLLNHDVWLIGHWSEMKVSDWCLTDVHPWIFVI